VKTEDPSVCAEVRWKVCRIDNTVLTVVPSCVNG
jgi:hypothetical protein